MLNVVFLFLIFIAVLGVMGKLRLIRPGGSRRRTKLPRPRKCPACGRFLLGSAGCDCGGTR